MPELRATHEATGAVSVLDGDIELFRYETAPDDPQVESPRPYLHPVRTRGGNLITGYRPHDHVWHKGISWALPVVEDENFWGGPSYVHGEGYRSFPNNGRQRSRGRVEVADGGEARIEHDLDWITQAGEQWFAERRVLTAATTGATAWVLTFETTMRNVRGADISIGSPTTRGRDDAGYGGLIWRGPRAFTGGSLIAPDVVGGDELRGQRHEWMAFTGSHDGVTAQSTLLMLDDAGNVRHEPQWFARTEEFAALAPAPFFSAELVVAAGATLRLRYGVGIADGAVDTAELADAVRARLRRTL